LRRAIQPFPFGVQIGTFVEETRTYTLLHVERAFRRTSMKTWTLIAAGASLLFFVNAATAQDLCSQPNVRCEVRKGCPVKGEVDGKTYCFPDERAKAYVTSDPKLMAALKTPMEGIRTMRALRLSCRLAGQVQRGLGLLCD
jgi:hypothetical protein